MLNNKELTMLRLMARGYTMDQAAERFTPPLKRGTALNYVRTAYIKLNVSTGIAAIVKAAQEGLIDIDDIETIPRKRE